MIAYPPHFLEDEIREHAPRIATETNTSLEDVFREWKQFRQYLCFYTARAKAKIDVSRTDPDDIAYIDTFEEIAARAIYTRDRDYLRTTVPVVLVSIDTELQQYARATSVRIGIVIGSCTSVVFGLEALIALSRLLSQLVRAVRRLPPAAQILIVGPIAVAVAHPKSRAKMLQLWERLNRNLKPAMWEAIVMSMNQFVEATAIANKSYEAIHDVLPPPKCQGRSKTRPVGRNKTRPADWYEGVGFAGEKGLWSVAEEAFLPRGVFGRASFRQAGSCVFDGSV